MRIKCQEQKKISKEDGIQFWEDSVIARMVVSKVVYVYWKRCSKMKWVCAS